MNQLITNYKNKCKKTAVYRNVNGDVQRVTHRKQQKNHKSK